MRSGLAIEMRIWSKLCGPETCPKMFINSFIDDPSRGLGHSRDGGNPGCRCTAGSWAPAFAGATLFAITPVIPVIRSLETGHQLVALLQLDVEAERAQFFDQHVEALRYAGLEVIVAADDRLVDLGAARDVVRLDCQHLLQGVGRAVGF